MTSPLRPLSKFMDQFRLSSQFLASTTVLSGPVIFKGPIIDPLVVGPASKIIWGTIAAGSRSSVFADEAHVLSRSVEGPQILTTDADEVAGLGNPDNAAAVISGFRVSIGVLDFEDPATVLRNPFTGGSPFIVQFNCQGLTPLTIHGIAFGTPITLYVFMTHTFGSNSYVTPYRRGAGGYFTLVAPQDETVDGYTVLCVRTSAISLSNPVMANDILPFIEGKA